jgi:hypothetical protein
VLSSNTNNSGLSYYTPEALNHAFVRGMDMNNRNISQAGINEKKFRNVYSKICIKVILSCGQQN